MRSTQPSPAASARPTAEQKDGKAPKPSREEKKQAAPKPDEKKKRPRKKTKSAAAEAPAPVEEKEAKASAGAPSSQETRAQGAYRATAGGKLRQANASDAGDEFESKSIGEIKRAERQERREAAKKSSRRHLMRFVAIIGVVVVLLAGWAALYNSPAFTIQNVSVEGVEHLTSDEMAQLANVPTDTTLLRVDTETIRNRLMQNAWVEDAHVNRLFPDTLQITVTERKIKAVVEVPNRSGSSVKQWAIAEDHTWLMPIPEKGSEAAKTTSSKIYEDAEAALHITDVPYGTPAEIGQVCTDSNIINALDILAGMTTDLAGQVVSVSAAGPAETTLLLDSGVEIAFGRAENIRDKERVIQQILAENPDGVAYINVRMVETPTWRAL